MEANMAQSLEEQLKCPVCLDLFRQPKLLACAHALCRECVDGLPRVDVEEEGKHAIECPTCRRPTVLPQDSAANLPPAFLLNTLIELHNANATKRVPSCAEPAGTGCSKHNRPLEMFCMDCQLSLCGRCFVLAHREHNCDYITDLIDRHKKKIGSHLAMAKKQVTNLLDTLDRLSNREKNIGIQGKEVKEEIDELVLEIVKAIQQSSAQLKKEVDELVQQESSKISSQREASQLALKKLMSIVMSIEEKLQSGSVEMLKERDAMINQLQRVKKEAKTENIDKSEMSIILHAPDIADKYANFGEVSIYYEAPETRSSDLTTIPEATTTQDEVQDKASGCSSNFKMFTKIENMMKPMGIAVAPNGSLIVTEHNEDQTIAIIERDSLTYTRFRHRGRACPRMACVAHDHKILVASDGVPYITKYDMNGKLVGSTTYTRPHDHNCVLKGVAVNSRGKVYICDSWNDCIHVLNADLTFSHSFGRTGNGRGQFNRPCGITIKHDIVYVCDKNNKRIQKFSAGRYMGEFEVALYPEWVAVNDNNILYVTSTDNTLTAYSLDGKVLVEAPSKGHGSIAVGNGLIYVCNSSENSIFVLYDL